MTSHLFYGDNLKILRERIRDETIHLIYLDPPFNSNRSYNVLFKDESGHEADAQIKAFDDSWHWGKNAQETFTELMDTAKPELAQLISSLCQFLGERNQMMAYLVMMAARLVELHRVLVPTGSLYLHCDPTASHYLKIILDTIFGAANFQNEIIWQRTSSHNDSRKWAAVHDVLLFYSKGPKFTWNSVYLPYDEKYLDDFYRYEDERGRYRLDHIIRSASMGPRPNLAYEYKGYRPEWGWRVGREKLQLLDQDDRIAWSKTGRPYLKRYLEEQKGSPVKSVISDIQPLSAQSAEKLGYPTQKPIALLERIISASSNPGEMVLDPFSGCGTAITAAQKLGREWIGIDITNLAITMHKIRLNDMFGLAPGKDYTVSGEPEDLAGACQLAQDDRYQFQFWALSLIQARPVGGGKGKKGADGGIDGVVMFVDDHTQKLKRALVQVKSGHVKSGDIRDLRGVLDREKDAPLGVFLTLEPPTAEMCREAVTAGTYFSPLWQRPFPRVQILTIEELLQGKTVQMPPTYGTYKAAQRERERSELSQLQFSQIK